MKLRSIMVMIFFSCSLSAADDQTGIFVSGRSESLLDISSSQNSRLSVSDMSEQFSASSLSTPKRPSREEFFERRAVELSDQAQHAAFEMRRKERAAYVMMVLDVEPDDYTNSHLASNALLFNRGPVEAVVAGVSAPVVQDGNNKKVTCILAMILVLIPAITLWVT